MSTSKQKLKKLLLEKSFRLGSFELSSGKKSDYYIDGRITSLDGEGAYLIATLLLDAIKSWQVSAVGGMTLGADPIVGAMVALSYARGNPLHGFIVRKQAKEHGTGKLVEGIVNHGERVAVVEDVVTTGSSALKAMEAVRAMGANVIGVVAVVDREEGGKDAFVKEGLKFKALFTASELKKSAKKM